MSSTKKKSRERPFSIPPQQAPSTNNTAGSLLLSNVRKSLEGLREENVIFSWQFFDRHHELFNCGDIDSNWYLNCIEVLHNLSRMKISEFKHEKTGGPPLRVHTHNWNKVSAKFNMKEELFDQIKDDAYQFALSKRKGRVHGFLIENIFYIVWLDPHHNLYPDDKFGGIKMCDPPDECFDCYAAERMALEEEKDQVYKEMDIFTRELEQKLKHEIKSVSIEYELKKNRNDFY
ncbi:hypothetical protein [Paenibacillus herberti]|uniref:Uncharacterized protein n=1 Tax=Paenibacillus herberti TaxID=1619309 RepID=A0A229P0E0_9BACL|nr:hypothetical protein [Paenibacillus herberti]OXM15454.1 hypothetical protein CGZ75_01565 [Paenibacillus herberti]